MLRSHTGDQTLGFSQNHESVSFCRLWNETVLLAKTTSPTYHIPHYKPSPLFIFFSLFVQNVENIMIELTIYMYTHTLHAKYCKHSSFLLFDLDFLPFVVGDCTPIILFLTPLNHCSAPSWVTSNAAVWKNKTSSRSQRKEQSPEAGLEDEEKGWGILFLSSRWAVIVSSFQDAFKIKKKIHLKH